MTGYSPLIRTLLVYGICLPLAVFLGYLLSEPLSYETIAVVGGVLFILVLPMLLRWHHVWLIAIWNAAMSLPFAPGRPDLWMVLAWMSLAIGVFQHMINRRFKFLSAPSVTKPLIILFIVVVITAELTGGFGMKVLGNANFGGKRYLGIICAVAGYFALISRRIPKERAMFYTTLFVLAMATQAIGDMVHLLPTFMRPLFYLFNPSAKSVGAAVGVIDTSLVQISRWGGIALAFGTVYFILLLRCGVQGVADLRHPIRMVIFVLAGAASLYGGFRLSFIGAVLPFAILFWLEGMFRSRQLPFFILAGIMGCALLAGFSDRLPLNFQRSLTLLPFKFDQRARQDAEASAEWRLQIWRDVIPTIPQYLLLGKGLSFSAAELQKLQAIEIAPTTGPGSDVGQMGAEYVGDYHNGPLSVIIPFGIWGMIAFVWFIGAGWRALYLNWKYGDPELAFVNRYLLAFYVSNTLIFFFIFGGFYSQLYIFTGMIGLNIAVNGGVARKPVVVVQRKPVMIRAPREQALAPSAARTA